MKQCSYCGAEYPDDATECAIDKTPFGEAPSETSPGIKLPTFAVFSEHEIPVSLTILSYLYFLPAALCFAYLACFMCLFFLSRGGSSVLDGWIILGCIAVGAIGLFFLCLSRGLRKCSRGWRTCTLVFIWWGFIGTAISIGRYLVTHKMPGHATTTEFLLSCAFTFMVQLWQYRVLTRQDVKDLFGV